jgi:hypothetical protein
MPCSPTLMDMFGHQGGWDEFLYAAVPIALIAGLLRLATTRARKLPPPVDNATTGESATDESD